MLEFAYKLREFDTVKKGEEEVKTPAKCAGTVTLKIPDPEERFEIIKEAQLKVKVNEEGKRVVDLTDKLDMAQVMVKIFKKYVVSIDIVHIKTGKHFTNLEEFSAYKVFNDVAGEVSDVLLNGIDLGED